MSVSGVTDRPIRPEEQLLERFPWKVVIVDSDPVVHETARRALDDFEYEGRAAHILSAFDVDEARGMVREHPDSAVLLIDIASATGRPELDLVAHVRQELGNHQIRVILRNRGEDDAALHELISLSDINDYRNRVNLSPLHFRAVILTALRSFNDIVSLRRSEARLRASERRFAALIRQASVGITRTGLNGRVTDVNERFCQLIGRTEEEIIGCAVGDYSHPDDRERTTRKFAQVLETGQEAKIEKRLLHSDGTVVPVQIIRSPLHDEAGRIAGVLSIVEDITERRAAEAALRASEERFRTLFDHAAVGLVVSHLDGRMELVNARVCQLLGRPAAELIGRSVWASVHPDDVAISRATFAEVIRSGVEETHERRYLWPDGTVRWARVTRLLLRNEAGNPHRVMTVSEDVTERRLAEEAVRVGEAQFASLFHQASVGISQSDVDGRFLLVNERFCKLVGRTEAELLGLNVADVTHPDDSHLSDERLDRAISSGRGDTIEKRYLRPDGETVWVSSSLSILHDREGNVSSTMALSFDITLRKRMEAERARLEEELRQSQKMEVLGQLTGGIAHDFNNLLLAIQLSLDGIEGETLDMPGVKPILDVALNATEQAQSLTGRLLAFGRRQTLHPSVADPNDILRDVAAVLERTMPANLAIKTVFTPARNFVSVDRNQLENAMFNLAINARDAMEEGGQIVLETGLTTIDPTAATARLAPGNYVTISVRDTGIGMPPSVVQRATEPFFTTKGVGRGTGLGLSQVYGFVAQSGGGMDIDSAEGCGTTVRLYLPVHVGASAAQPSPERQPTSATGGSETILVVEDNPVVCGAVVRLLSSLGYRVLVAKSGDEALTLLESDAALDLLFSDVMLPGDLNGVRLAEESRRIRPDLPVLITTGYDNGTLPTGALGDDIPVLAKPYQTADLARTLRQVLGAGRAPPTRH